MTTTFKLTVALIITATAAQAESKIDTLCGAGHVNEISSLSDVSANPDGFYVKSLAVQMSHGDPRIVRAVGKEFHLCTRPAATPDMDANRAMLMENERSIKYLFVPTNCPTVPAS